MCVLGKGLEIDLRNLVYDWVEFYSIVKVIKDFLFGKKLDVFCILYFIFKWIIVGLFGIMI